MDPSPSKPRSRRYLNALSFLFIKTVKQAALFFHARMLLTLVFDSNSIYVEIVNVVASEVKDYLKR